MMVFDCNHVPCYHSTLPVDVNIDKFLLSLAVSMHVKTDVVYFYTVIILYNSILFYIIIILNVTTQERTWIHLIQSGSV